MLLVIATPLVFASPILVLGSEKGTKIQIADDRAMLGDKPAAVVIRISDPDGVDTAHLYFRSPLTETFAFVPLELEGDKYAGTLPAPRAGTHHIDQLILVKDGAGRLSQSRFFLSRVKAPKIVDKQALKQPVAVYSELLLVPDSVEGLPETSLLTWWGQKKYGVVAGLIFGVATGTDAAETSISEPVSERSNTIKYNNTVPGRAGAVVAVALLAGSAVT